MSIDLSDDHVPSLKKTKKEAMFLPNEFKFRNLNHGDGSEQNPESHHKSLKNELGWCFRICLYGR